MTKILDEPFIDRGAWTAVSGTWSTTVGRTGNGQQSPAFTSIRYSIPAALQTDTVTIGFAFYIVTANTGAFLELRSDTGGTVHLNIERQSDGSLRINRGASTQLAVSAAGVLAVSAWNYVELQAKMHDTAGFATARVNGVEVASYPVGDTKNAGTKTVFDAVQIGTIGSNASYIFDDLYLSTGDAFEGDHPILGYYNARQSLRVAVVTPGAGVLYRQAVRVGIGPVITPGPDGAATITFTAAADGVWGYGSPCSSTITFTASATATYFAQGSGDATLIFTGFALPGEVVQASGASTIAFVGAATGFAPIPLTGEAEITFTALATPVAQTYQAAAGTTLRFEAFAVAGFEVWQERITATLVDGVTYQVKRLNLARVWGYEWQDNLSQSGVGRMRMQNDDPDLPLVEFGDLIRFGLDGIPVFTWRVERLAQQVVAGGEEAEQVTEVTGRGALARLQRAVVYNERNDPGWLPYSDDRTFSFASIDFDDSGDEWGRFPQSFGLQGYDDSPWWHNPDGTLSPINWPDPHAQRLWGHPGDINEAPVGTCYFRGRIQFRETLETLVVITADNFFKLWIDGVPILSEETDHMSWQKSFSAHVTMLGTAAALRPGEADHVYAIRANNADPRAPTNPAHLLLTQAIHNVGVDVLGEVVFRSDTKKYNWKVCSYPTTPPGWTAGAIILSLLEEATQRGVDLGLTPSFTAAVDTAGAPWDVIPEFTVKIGVDYLSVIETLAASVCDFAVSGDGMVFHAWRYGTRGAASAVVLTPGVNLTELRHEGEV